MARKHLSELLALSAEDKQSLAEVLLDSIELPVDEHGRVRPLYEKEWIAEVRRRQALGRPGIPGEQVFAQAREKLRAMARSKAR